MRVTVFGLLVYFGIKLDATSSEHQTNSTETSLPVSGFHIYLYLLILTYYTYILLETNLFIYLCLFAFWSKTKEQSRMEPNELLKKIAKG